MKLKSIQINFSWPLWYTTVHFMVLIVINSVNIRVDRVRGDCIMRLFVVLWNWKNLINICVDFIPSGEQENGKRERRNVRYNMEVMPTTRLGLRFTVKYNKQAGFELIKWMLSRAIFNLFANACFTNWIGFLFCWMAAYGDFVKTWWNYLRL